jgi:hypothetical protein
MLRTRTAAPSAIMIVDQSAAGSACASEPPNHQHLQDRQMREQPDVLEGAGYPLDRAANANALRCCRKLR